MVRQAWNRRDLLKGAISTCGAAILSQTASRALSHRRQSSGGDSELQIIPISAHAFRLSILRSNEDMPIPSDGCLVRESWGTPIRFLPTAGAQTTSLGAFRLTISSQSATITIRIANNRGDLIQQLCWYQDTRVLSFLVGSSPLLGLGQGGPQFDRRGSVDAMRSGQGGYQLATHGARVPIPWIIGTAGWAMFFHQPFGSFDFTGDSARFQPANPASTLPLDLFFIASLDPGTIMGEYARLTGHAQMPPMWSFGYQQSHRTLADPNEVLSEAKTFREKALPCDALIYLGTGFCPSGWNTGNGSFAWNSRVFPDPRQILGELRSRNFHSVMHVVILSDKLQGSVHDRCELPRFDETKASCYWDAHRQAFAMGVDGWWPDEGDSLDPAARLVRNRMYWEGPQIDRPNQRPYALHRNGYAGMQRYGSFLWSGDVYSTWETLRTQIPVAINAALSGIPYWGTDIGGFVPTREFTAELYLRWFQFGAFCTLFRSHGRAWKLRLPWGWNTGDPGPAEIGNYAGAAIPDPDQLHDPRVESVCKKYLELRYQMLPYLYSAVRECATTGMPILRALWLHFPEDPKAVACPDQYLWGKNLLVAPVVEKGAATRRVYLPNSSWYDFWTKQRIDGPCEIDRPVDLATIPLYVRAGSILPVGPVRQYAAEKIDSPLSISIYPGADGRFLLYEDDGVSFNYRHGEWMGIQMAWDDARKRLHLRLAPGSRMLPPGHKDLVVDWEGSRRPLRFTGKPVGISL